MEGVVIATQCTHWRSNPSPDPPHGRILSAPTRGFGGAPVGAACGRPPGTTRVEEAERGGAGAPRPTEGRETGRASPAPTGCFPGACVGADTIRPSVTARDGRTDCNASVRTGSQGRRATTGRPYEKPGARTRRGGQQIWGNGTRRGGGAPPYNGAGNGPGKPGPYGIFPGSVCRGGYHPPVGDRQGRGDGLPRQWAHWLAMTGRDGGRPQVAPTGRLPETTRRAGRPRPAVGAGLIRPAPPRQPQPPGQRQQSGSGKRRRPNPPCIPAFVTSGNKNIATTAGF